MKKINLKKINKPIKINQKKYFDNRGYFQEIFLKNFSLLTLNLQQSQNLKKEL